MLGGDPDHRKPASAGDTGPQRRHQTVHKLRRCVALALLSGCISEILITGILFRITWHRVLICFTWDNRDPSQYPEV
jgi:hypothetical protein